MSKEFYIADATSRRDFAQREFVTLIPSTARKLWETCERAYSPGRRRRNIEVSQKCDQSPKPGGGVIQPDRLGVNGMFEVGSIDMDEDSQSRPKLCWPRRIRYRIRFRTHGASFRSELRFCRLSQLSAVPGPPACGFERAIEVRDNVVDVFDSRRKSHETILDPERLAVFRR